MPTIPIKGDTTKDTGVFQDRMLYFPLDTFPISKGVHCPEPLRRKNPAVSTG